MAVSGSSPMSYEEARRQRMEENKKRMEELGLMNLSKSLKVASTPPRKPVKRRMPSLEELGMEARRSSRVAGKPTVSYRDQLDVLPGMRARCGTRERQGLARRYMSDKSRMAAIARAEEVYKDITNPAFLKPMLHSHTASGFWLGLPAIFCKTHLPHRDDHVMLEDETQKEWECVYLANKVGLSGGWRGFSLDHDLVDGDCLIFELVTPTRFKIYIFRAQELPGGEDDDDVELTGGAASGEAATEKKVATKANGKKKGGASSAPAKSEKPRKLSATAARKLKLEKEEDNDEAEIDDEDDSPSKKSSKKDVKRGGKRAADADKAGPSRSSKRLRMKEEDDDSVKEEDDSDVDVNKGNNVRLSERKGKEPAEDEVVELNSDEEDDKDDAEDAWKPSSRSKAKQNGAGCRSSGRVTRNSVAKSLR